MDSTERLTCHESCSRAALAARAAPTVGDAIARAHAAALLEAGSSLQREWIQRRLDHELHAAQSLLRSALADDASVSDALQLAEMLQLCCTWRSVDAEFSEHERRITLELLRGHGIAVEVQTQSSRRGSRRREDRSTA